MGNAHKILVRKPDEETSWVT